MLYRIKIRGIARLTQVINFPAFIERQAIAGNIRSRTIQY
jgi:hypothetical protein